jgi:hypothetical protein
MKQGCNVLHGRLAALLLGIAGVSTAAPVVHTNLFLTRFEPVEGYDPAYVLAGQNGWNDYAELNGNPVPNLLSNGLTTNVFVGFGQQAWIGGIHVGQPVDSVSVWHPLILDPVPTDTPVIRFSVLMAIEGADASKFDFFRWSIYNSQTNRLFSLDFENATDTIAYLLDDGVFHDVATPFYRDTIQQLEVSIHFAANQWNAWLDGDQIVTNAPVTTRSQKRTLGEIDAVWLPGDPNNRTDRLMYFDNFQLDAESLPTPPVQPELLTLGRTVNGYYALRLLGENGARYAIDYSPDASTWTALKTNIAVDGSFDYVDTNAPIVPERIFRARLLSE